MDVVIGALVLLLLVALVVLMLHLFLIRPLYLGVRRLAWAVSGQVERDDPPEPVTEEHPRFVARLAPPSEEGTHSYRYFALAVDGRVLVVRDDPDAFGWWDPATARRTHRVPVRYSTNDRARAVSPDGSLFADIAGRDMHLARVYSRSGAEPVDVTVRHGSAVYDDWLADGDEDALRRDCEEAVRTFGFAAATARGEQPLVVLTDLQSFVGGRLTGECGPGAVLIRTYDVAQPGAPLLAEVLHEVPRRGEGCHDREAVLSPDARLVAVGSDDRTSDDPVEVLDRATGRSVCRIEDGPGRPLAFSPDGGLLVCNRERTTAERGILITRCTVSVWDVPAGRLRSRWVAPRRLAFGAAVVGGPTALVALGVYCHEEVRRHSRRGVTRVDRGRPAVTVHRLDDGALLHDFPVSSGSLAFAAAGGRLVVSGSTGLTLWSTKTARAAARFE